VATELVGASVELVRIVAPSEADGTRLEEEVVAGPAEPSFDVPAAPAVEVAVARLVESVEPVEPATIVAPEFDETGNALAVTGAAVERPVVTTWLPEVLSVTGASEVVTVVVTDGAATVVSPEPSVVVDDVVLVGTEEDTTTSAVGDAIAAVEPPADTDCEAGELVTAAAGELLAAGADWTMPPDG
jgi:hypothetical protein